MKTFKHTIVTLLLAYFGLLPARAAQVDTILTYSEAMQKEIKAVVILPDDYELMDSVPVLYLLHGYGGNYANWLRRSPELPDLVDRYRFMVVCADGARGSWYWDSPIDPAYRYETYVALELPDWIDARYKTVKGRHGRAITGLSMGGHGALYLAFKHQDRYGAAGSTAGGVDFRPFPLNWRIADRLGSYAEHPERWNQHTVINMLHLLTPGSLSLIIDCGVNDFFYDVNEAFHRELTYRNIPHTYITGPGKHDTAYWRRSIRGQMQYFHYFFYGNDEEGQ